MDYTIELIERIRHRYITLAALHNSDSEKPIPDVRTLIDTGAFNTMIDIYLAKSVGIMLPIKIPISIGGNLGEAQGCILPKIVLGDFQMQSVFALAYPFKDWLARYIILGANVLNNWDFNVSRTDNVISLKERIPFDVPNKEYPYRNYFTGGEYVAVQNDGDLINENH